MVVVDRHTNAAGQSFPVASDYSKDVSMQESTASRSLVDRQHAGSDFPSKNEAYTAGISWPAVIGGAFVAAALSLILLVLGTGLGFSSISPWSNMGVSASTIGKGAIAWLVVTQILASAMGGYLAGRLRTKWVHVHTDEVYFRDTAHGLLVWAVGLVVTASFLASAAASIAGQGTQYPGNRAPAATEVNASLLSPYSYSTDTLLRGGASSPEGSDASERGEVERLLAHGLRQGALSSADKAYLIQLVSAKTGLSESDAEKRVSDVLEEARQSAERARKALAHLSLWLFVALLSGAFCASYAGTIGGKQRDHVPV